MNRKLRVGVDNLTQDLKDLTLPSARHTFVGLIAIAVCVYINAWAIALPFCLSFMIGKTGPLLLLIATPIVCAISVFLLSLVLSKNKPKEAEEIIYAKEACKMLKEVLDNGVAYTPSQIYRGEHQPERSTRIDCERGQRDYYSNSRQEPSAHYTGGFERDSRRSEYRPNSDGYDTSYSGADTSGADPRYVAETPQRDEAMRKPNPYAYDGNDLPSEEEVRSFYRRAGGERPASTYDPRSGFRDSEPTRGDERISVEERESSSNPAEPTGRNSSGEQDITT